MDGGEPVDAGSALMIMTLGAGNGAEVTVASADDEDSTGKTVAELGAARPRRAQRRATAHLDLAVEAQLADQTPLASPRLAGGH